MTDYKLKDYYKRHIFTLLLEILAGKR